MFHVPAFTRRLREVLSSGVWWLVYFPLFKTGKLSELEIIKFQGSVFEVVTTDTIFFGKKLYNVSRVPEGEDLSWRTYLAQQGVVVSLKNLEGKTLEEFHQAHPALKRFDPKSNLHTQF